MVETFLYAISTANSTISLPVDARFSSFCGIWSILAAQKYPGGAHLDITTKSA
jgi:hypothetical protein